MTTQAHWTRIASPLGPMLLIARGNALTGIHFVGERYEPALAAGWRHAPEDPLLRAAQGQLDDYFAGARRTFDLPLAPMGTAFQRAVWTAIAGVRYGQTIAYGELAARAGHPGSVRAVGAATGRNPWTIIVPCHRIVGANGALTGYAGGLERKRALLALEAAPTPLALEAALARAA